VVKLETKAHEPPQAGKKGCLLQRKLGDKKRKTAPSRVCVSVCVFSSEKPLAQKVAAGWEKTPCGFFVAVVGEKVVAEFRTRVLMSLRPATQLLLHLLLIYTSCLSVNLYGALLKTTV